MGKALNSIKQGYKTRNSSNNREKEHGTEKTEKAYIPWKAVRANEDFVRASDQENKHNEKQQGASLTLQEFKIKKTGKNENLHAVERAFVGTAVKRVCSPYRKKVLGTQLSTAWSSCLHLFKMFTLVSNCSTGKL